MDQMCMEMQWFFNCIFISNILFWGSVMLARQVFSTQVQALHLSRKTHHMYFILFTEKEKCVINYTIVLHKVDTQFIFMYQRASFGQQQLKL